MATTQSRRGVDLDRLAELEEQRAFLLRSLDDLDRELAAGDLELGDYETLRADYTARAAEVIRAIDDGRAVLPPRRPAPGSRGRRIVTAVCLVGVAAGLGIAVAQSAGERAPGKPASGSIRSTSNDLLAEARVLMGQGEALEAIKRYDTVLDADPANREALAYKGWLLVLVGQSGEPALIREGVQLLDRAVAADPRYADARFFRGFVRFRQLDDPQGALVDLQAFLDADPPPDLVPGAMGLLRKVEAAVKQAGPSTTVATSQP